MASYSQQLLASDLMSASQVANTLKMYLGGVQTPSSLGKCSSGVVHLPKMYRSTEKDPHIDVCFFSLELALFTFNTKKCID